VKLIMAVLLGAFIGGWFYIAYREQADGRWVDIR